MELERLERLKLENAVKTGSLPDDDKVGLTQKSPAQLIASSALAKFGMQQPGNIGGIKIINHVISQNI